ncbi:MAG: hypothetical protein ACOX7U_01850 [Desulfitobacteriia bacterium]|jgi:hypothetical protein
MGLNRQNLELFFFRLALLSGGLVAVLTFLNKHTFLGIVWRSIFAFAVLFLLGQVLLYFWDKLFAVSSQKKDENPQVDYILGVLNKERRLKRSTAEPENGVEQNLPGQISEDLKNGLTDEKTKVDLLRKMGWEEDGDKGV